MNKLLADFENNRLKILDTIFLFIALASGYFTFGGAAIDAGSFLELAAATVLALASSAAIYSIWHVGLRVIAAKKSRREWLLVCGLTFCAVAAITQVSSVFNVARFAGNPARELHVAHYIEEASENVASANFAITTIDSIASDLRLGSERYNRAFEGEDAGGMYSGAPGEGAVRSALGMTRDRFAAMSAEVERFQRMAAAKYRSATRRIETLRETANSDAPLEVRMREISRESDLLAADLAAMDSRAIAGSIERALAALPTEIDMHADFSSNSATARRQEAALTNLKIEITNSTTDLQEFAHGLAEREPKRFEAMTKITALKAIMVYWDSFLGFWAAGLAIDLTPLIVILYIAIAAATLTPEEREYAATMNQTVEELMRANAGRHLINEKQLSASQAHLIGRGGTGGPS